jgi:hypothetical protein
LALAGAWGVNGGTRAALPSATQSDARLLLKRAADGACLVRGANLTYGNCDAGATWLLQGHPEKGWALQGAEPGDDDAGALGSRSPRSTRSSGPQCISGHWKQLKMGPCDDKHRWLLQPSPAAAGEWHLVWKVLFSNLGQKTLCVGVPAGPSWRRALARGSPEAPHAAARPGLTETNCTAFKVYLLAQAARH